MAPPTLDLSVLVQKLKSKKGLTVSEVLKFIDASSLRSAHRALDRIRSEGFVLIRMGEKGDYRYRILEA
ncbi:hypothetical protein DRH13_00085 [Candidatus Woesebacteria bacterium]|nr:MAG: hypothetical protein DRH13_00085 [Candidatus Woesebacteria bacterium]